MSEEPMNPYAVPQAEVIVIEAAEVKLERASRGRRLAGALIDGLLLAVGFELCVRALRAVLGFSPISGPGTTEGIGDSLLTMLRITLMCFVSWVLIHGWLLVTRGQTVGKLILGMRIVHPDGSRVVGPRLLVLRYGVPMLIYFNTPFIKLIIFLINALWIFGPQRRCLHDLLANTIVIKI